MRVRDIRDGLFHVNEGKTEASIRAVPIHSELAEVIKNRTEGKKPDDYLIHEIKRDTKGVLRRSAVFVKRFGRYRDKVFPEYRSNGHRQAAKVFHDLRAHFIDERLKRGVPLEIVKDCVGHEQEGVTLRHYATKASI
jgi:integrase